MITPDVTITYLTFAEDDGIHRPDWLSGPVSVV